LIKWCDITKQNEKKNIDDDDDDDLKVEAENNNDINSNNNNNNKTFLLLCTSVICLLIALLIARYIPSDDNSLSQTTHNVTQTCKSYIAESQTLRNRLETWQEERMIVWLPSFTTSSSSSSSGDETTTKELDTVAILELRDSTATWTSSGDRFLHVTRNDEVWYRGVRHDEDNVESASMAVSVRTVPPPPPVDTTTVVRRVYLGDRIELLGPPEHQFEGASTGSSFQWYRNGLAVAGATKRDLIVNSIEAIDLGTYVCVATDPVEAGGGTRRSGEMVVMGMISE